MRFDPTAHYLARLNAGHVRRYRNPIPLVDLVVLGFGAVLVISLLLYITGMPP